MPSRQINDFSQKGNRKKIELVARPAPLQYIFQTEALALSDLIFLVALSSSVFIAAEVRKAYFNSSQSGSSRAMSKFSLKSKLIDLKGRSSSPPTPFIKSSLKKKGSEHMV